MNVGFHNSKYDSEIDQGGDGARAFLYSITISHHLTSQPSHSGTSQSPSQRKDNSTSHEELILHDIQLTTYVNSNYQIRLKPPHHLPQISR